MTGENISPSVLAGAKKGKVKGLLLAKGSRTAHVCILAANMGIPAVVGCIGAEKIKDGDMVFVDGTAGKAAWEMDEAARADALAETVSYQEKQKILEKYTEKKGQTKDKVSVQIMANIMDAQAAEQAKQWVAVPGCSEHQLGIAVDINGATYDLYFWLQENSYKYGFIFRYPGNKTDITGTAEEVWHYRYVGVEAATEMYEQGLCLEEYLSKAEN